MERGQGNQPEFEELLAQALKQPGVADYVSLLEGTKETLRVAAPLLARMGPMVTCISANSSTNSLNAR